MDAAPVDADVKLYKASAELLAELQTKVLLLLQDAESIPRRWVLVAKTAELTRLLDVFQEWPQLLDPLLADLVQVLVNAFLGYCINSADHYHRLVSVPIEHIEQLPRAICRILYVLCKVRGYKVIVRLFNNETKYIEPLLVCFKKWNNVGETGQGWMSWKERYIMLLWLSHLMLAPFELRTISGFRTSSSSSVDSLHVTDLPDVANVLLEIALAHLCVAGKDREAASWLIVRLALRKDMQTLMLSQCVVRWCTEQLLTDDEHAPVDQYRHLGLLTLLYGITNSSSSTEAAAFIQHTFDTCKLLTTDTSSAAVSVRNSAPSRKLLIKTMRASILHALAQYNATLSEGIVDLDTMLEDGIQILLEWLADSDTPVRQASSKALGMIILKLDTDMAAEVNDAVLGCLNESVLLEDRRTGQLTAAVDILNVDPREYKKNVNAVNPLKWHGAMLTLGHVLFRRSPPAEQLPLLLEALLMGLVFEQRSNVGTSLGVGVRDAACFGIWSLARKYTTTEVEAASLSPAALSHHSTLASGSRRTLQIVATELVLASCLDLSGNLRRGASAALQELIGRHPDTIHEGIAVVQSVDYHAVARRSRAMTEVSTSVAKLGEVYHTSLLHSLLDWRGCRAVDATSRRQAAATVGTLFARARPAVKTAFTTELVSQISDLKESNVGSNAATRHGLLSCLAACICTSQDHTESAETVLKSLLEPLDDLHGTMGTLDGRVTPDLANVFEAIAELFSAFAGTNTSTLSSSVGNMAESVAQILDRCTTATEDHVVSAAAARANMEVFTTLEFDSQKELLESWLPNEFSQQRTIYTCRGRIESMSRLMPLLSSDARFAPYQYKIASFLASIVSSGLSIETKVNAMDGICITLNGITTHAEAWVPSLAEAILVGLADYTVDQRGDIGSLLRLASIDAVHNLHHRELDRTTVRQLLKQTVRLSADKLMKVRFAAWNCIQSVWATLLPELGSLQSFEHQADISSLAYYQQLTKLLEIEWLRNELLHGFVGSIAGGAEDISQTASSALVLFIDEQASDKKKSHLNHMIIFLLGQLKALAKHEDREVVPFLDCLCLLREQFVLETDDVFRAQRENVLDLIDRLQVSIADIPRIQSLIRLLSGLSSIPEFRLDVAEKYRASCCTDGQKRGTQRLTRCISLSRMLSRNRAIGTSHPLRTRTKL